MFPSWIRPHHPARWQWNISRLQSPEMKAVGMAVNLPNKRDMKLNDRFFVCEKERLDEDHFLPSGCSIWEAN